MVLPAKELPCLTSWARPASCRADVRVKRSADGVYQSVSASCVQTLCVVWAVARRRSEAPVIRLVTVNFPVSVLFSVWAASWKVK